MPYKNPEDAKACRNKPENKEKNKKRCRRYYYEHKHNRVNNRKTDDKAKERVRNYYQANKEKVRLRSKKRYEEKKEEIHAKAKIYREKNKEIFAAKAKAKRDSIPGWLESVANNNSKKMPIKLTSDQLMSKLITQDWKCAYSGEQLTRWNAELDHIIPKAEGGGNSLENLQWVTKKVNRMKRDLLESEFFALIIQISKYRKEDMPCVS